MRRLLLDGEQVGIREREAIDAWEKVKLEIMTEAQRRAMPTPGCFRSEASVDTDQRPFEAMVERITKSNPNAIYVKRRDLYCIN